MPTYEYVCKSCGETLEVFQSFADKPLKKHKECGGDLKKVFHARGIVFKGGGFYATDSRAALPAKTSDKTEKKSGKTEKKTSATTGAVSNGGETSSSGD